MKESFEEAMSNIMDRCLGSKGREFEFEKQSYDQSGDIHNGNKNNNIYCAQCDNLGVVLEHGDIFAKATLCKSCSDGQFARRYGQFDVGSFYKHIVRLPNSHSIEIDKDANFERVNKWYDSLSNNKGNRSLLITGLTGLGKSLLANHFMIQYLKDCSKVTETTCYSTSIPEIIESFDYYNSSKSSFHGNQQANDDKHRDKKKWESLRKKCIEADYLVIDEIGLSKKEQEPLHKIIENREKSNKITVYTSNHSFSPEHSLKKKTLKSILGERIESRLKACAHIHFTGKDKRTAEQLEVTIDEESMEKFEMDTKVQIISKERGLEKSKTQVMTWITRNPVFESVSKVRRNKLQETIIDKKGRKHVHDKDRSEPKIANGIWDDDDFMTITGPVCDYRDLVLYHVLLKMLAKQHNSGLKGLSLYTNKSKVIEEIQLPQTQSSYDWFDQSVVRLVRVNIDYRKRGKRVWAGGFLTNISTDRIDFNKYMVPFYKEEKYTIMSGSKVKKLKGHALLMYQFLESHEEPEKFPKINVDFWKDLLSIEAKDPEKSMRKALKALKEQTYISDRAGVKNGFVHHPVISAE